MQSHRNKFVVHVKKIQRDNANGTNFCVGIQPTNCLTVKLSLNKDQKAILDSPGKGRKAALGKDKREGTEKTAAQIMETR